VEKNTRKSEAPNPGKARSFFSVNRPDDAKKSVNSSVGITIQIRLKNPAQPPAERARLLTRQNTEFWLSAND
jgi:hypothetical protein